MPRLFRPVRRSRAWPAMLAMAIAACAAPAAAKGTAPADPIAVEGTEAAAPATATSPTASPAPRFRVRVDAPPPLKETLERDVGLVRWQDYAEMTDDLLDRLMGEAVEQARLAAAAEGFFSATIDVTIDRGAAPPLVTLRVDVGPPTRIASVRIDVTGPATTDVPLGTDAIARLRREWGLPEGDVFRQTAWTAAKERALATLATSPYAAARIDASEASIDPGRETAELFIALASGPPFRFGALEITGLARYPESLVRNFRAFEPGDPYSAQALDRFLRRLNASGYFASVQGRIDPDTSHPDDATLFISVIEAPTRRFEGGLGYSTDVQYRATATYRDVNLDGKGLQLLAEGRLETKVQSGSVRFTRPPTDSGWIGTFGGGAEQTDIEGLVTRTLAAGTRWHTVEEWNEQALSATYYLDEQEPSGAPTKTAHAVYAEYERYWRRVDNLVAPSSGWMASVQAGGGIPGVSTRSFGRVLGRFAWWLPIGRTSELNVRAEGGAVLTGSREGVPSTLLFRTGGDTTVRGYAFESLGVTDGDAVVPGRYYAVVSAEAIRWVSPAWGIAAFVDAGNAVDSVSDAHLALGYGLGARVRTPLGPFRLDLAYGQDADSVRAHLSVGISF